HARLLELKKRTFAKNGRDRLNVFNDELNARHFQEAVLCARSVGLAQAKAVSIKTPVKRQRKMRRANDDGEAAVEAVPLHSRQSLQALSSAVKIPTTTLWRYVKEGSVLRRANILAKPILSAHHMEDRLSFSLQHVSPIGVVLLAFWDAFPFDPMLDSIHIDDTWFYINKAIRKAYLLIDESVHKLSLARPMIKVMFLVAAARLSTVTKRLTAASASGLLAHTHMQNKAPNIDQRANRY
ncbi:TPA: hypothetical protein N0F65_009205, partial [Lagenidium giganteum]